MRVSHFYEIDENFVVNVTMKIMKVIIIFWEGGRGKTIFQVREEGITIVQVGGGGGGERPEKIPTYIHMLP